MARSKYGAKKITIDGNAFDSKDEGKYYEYLKKLKFQEKILNFELQPRYELRPAFEKMGKKYRKAEYVADFLIYHLDGTEEVIDVKGMATETAKLKRKLFDEKYRNLKLTWIVRSLKYSETGWIEYDELQKVRREEKKGAKNK
ncbi:hypothetical protein phiCTC2A_16 (endogenous virus) [Clostridium phage phiCTC2A]|uniref:Phage-related protein n=1 Tax=Clostridium tetani (strain Massachusetts / E88) TaxID=212717 RepID=Q896C9_CLOTE|nr:DUF1064 domain-containing protein [Clostridium tetani]YP_009277223.1 Holliday junction resolvase [Clostridium phage phiCTC2A]YP_009277290.1 Holliday junction resolvase [Clostridium phage phiCT19406A]AAO35661.1 phage-related protein [Clostridium tetani E88]AJA42706.1 hypothetical protein phiCT19406A_16 [Clostridium phage phiCT19406A]AJA42902.1 hypothetical protein phiCTC2A_16 [Clostridium phage phiCTC2A]KGI38455.1 hypothetical protein KY52_08240 [Clostridium tetani]KGI42903.1 hypothetical 